MRLTQHPLSDANAPRIQIHGSTIQEIGTSRIPADSRPRRAPRPNGRKCVPKPPRPASPVRIPQTARLLLCAYSAHVRTKPSSRRPRRTVVEDTRPLSPRATFAQPHSTRREDDSRQMHARRLGRVRLPRPATFRRARPELDHGRGQRQHGGRPAGRHRGGFQPGADRREPPRGHRRRGPVHHRQSAARHLRRHDGAARLLDLHPGRSRAPGELHADGRQPDVGRRARRDDHGLGCNSCGRRPKRGPN